ncbi:CLUMA_CG014501, isoform A [Clunio marinus]|uniref:CLUMA_CG014501, isoform A n=1 Tax=Clunio marinus TaxID=568069 RepID=A0A1J1IRG3_9DIPT|nr:CLUMA_CG014501, isoform A [Clunio marinus]
MKFYIFITILLSSHLAASQVKSKYNKHPYEIDLGDLKYELKPVEEKGKEKKSLDCDSYYRRIVKYIFAPKRFEKSNSNSKFYNANVPLKITDEQYEMIVKMGCDGLNLNEIDDIIAEVFEQSVENYDLPVAQIIIEHYSHQFIESLPSMTSSIMLLVSLLIIVFALNRVYYSSSKLTFSARILFLFLAICACSFSMSYFDCLNDLEVEELVKLSKEKSGNNPCKDYHGERENFFSSLRVTLFGSSENKCLEHMRKTLKTSKKYCDPLEVFSKWIGKIQMSYFSSIFGQFFDIFTNASSSSNVITRILIWVVGGVVLAVFLLFVVKDVIKHFIQGMFNTVRNTNVYETSNTQQSPSNASHEYSALSNKIDKILNEHVELKRELSIIRECSVDRVLPEIKKPSIKSGEEIN